MSGNKTWRAAAVAAGLVALAALIGCGGEKSVASKSAAAFEEARKRGETFGGEGHAHGNDHGHGAPPATGEEHIGHGAPDAPAAGGTQHGTGHEGMEHAGHGAAGGESPVDHSAMGHGAGAQSGGHAGHGAPAAQAPAGHASHSPSAGEAPSRPVAELPAQPAGILRPDPLDAPAATSVADAQRSAEMAREMSGGAGGHGGHEGGHGAGTYRQIDAGRGPDAHEGSEPQTPGAGPQQHDHGAAPGQEKEQAALYACPMHPEVTSNTPGTCPKCGMTLVERREE